MKTVLAGLLVLGALSAGPGASAEDRRPCVSVREFKAAHNVYLHKNGADRITRRQLEARWEVRPVVVADPFLPALAYKRCGYGLQESWFGAAYNRDGYLFMLVTMKNEGATPHGRP